MNYTIRISSMNYTIRISSIKSSSSGGCGTRA
jgi:hypothetical protein